ncbi:hypothetical protein M2132_001152 [Dysgonomonas sp. PH5-45]|uniref:hypothetical protein n=1 Tax=unclassified Dysgonomonas TaxID=2630389 RepID=UPI002477214A|nr:MULTISPECIES: hypothetical protein [unclassified Dysgonomonas]MDH6354821.1 hypothetical protein [Dysgonomonas sp. PH5-45]MDH6387720.1 hypothetical protein [Dysgonomonas sp. PH5-37]
MKNTNSIKVFAISLPIIWAVITVGLFSGLLAGNAFLRDFILPVILLVSFVLLNVYIVKLWFAYTEDSKTLKRINSELETILTKARESEAHEKYELFVLKRFLKKIEAEE